MAMDHTYRQTSREEHRDPYWACEDVPQLKKEKK